MSTTETTTFATNNPYRQSLVSNPSSPPPTAEPTNGPTTTPLIEPSASNHNQLPPSPPASPLSPRTSKPPRSPTSPVQAQAIPASGPNQITSPKTTTKPNDPPREVFRTRSLGGPFAAAVVFERVVDLSPPNDDEIIIATVRYPTTFRRASFQENAPLPSRPPARGFLRRMSTRWNSERGYAADGSGVGTKYTYLAMKMPRRDYKMYFALDSQWKYIGTEPERDWTRQEIEERYAEYQDMPLRTVPGLSEYAEDYTGEVRRASQTSRS